MNDNAIFSVLERLGAQMPWDTVEITVRRSPDGTISFQGWVPSDSDRGVESILAWGDTLADLCRSMEKQSGDRDPEAHRQRALEQLRSKIARLESADFTCPPYRPGTRLAAGALAPEVEV